MTSATSERTSSAPLCWRLKNYLRSTIKQDRLIKCLRMHCQKWITTTNDTVKIAKRFPGAKEQRKGHFGKFDHGYVYGCVKMTPPPPSPITFQNAPPPLQKSRTFSPTANEKVSDGRQQTNSLFLSLNLLFLNWNCHYLLPFVLSSKDHLILS